VIDQRSSDRIAAYIRQIAGNRAAARAAASRDREFVRDHYTAAQARDTFRLIVRDAARAMR
jgi:hypothetical protein